MTSFEPAEFREEVEYKENPQTPRVHVIKQNVHPILISPYYKKDIYALANKYHIELVPTWLLVKLAGETLGKKLEMRNLFKRYMKEGGGPIEAFLSEVFRKK